MTQYRYHRQIGVFALLPAYKRSVISHCFLSGEKTLLFFYGSALDFYQRFLRLQLLSAGTAKLTVRLHFLPALRAVFLRYEGGSAFTAEFSILLVQLSAIRTFDTDHFLDNRLLQKLFYASMQVKRYLMLHE